MVPACCEGLRLQAALQGLWRENIPAPVETMPDTWIVADYALCGGRRRYLPPDIFRGRLSYRLRKKPVQSQREAPPQAR